MTYPAALYDGDGGEATATLRRTDAPHDLVFANGNTTDYLATGAITGGRFGLYRWNMSAEASGATAHFHRTLEESFFILAGTIRIFDGREWRDTRPGDFVHVPPGGLHGFRNESGEPASMLIHFAPGAPREAYFEGLARWGFEGRPSEDEAQAFFEAHDNRYV